MRLKKPNKTQYLLYDTKVDNLFISEYMNKASGNAVKVYLTALMYQELDQPLDNRSIARDLGISIDEVVDCWAYWEREGILSRIPTEEGNPYAFDIEFYNLREGSFAPPQIINDVRPAIDLSNRDLSQLYKDVEEIVGRLLEGKEIEAIASFVAEYGMEPGLIKAGYKYCTDRKKSTRPSYVGAILKDWKDKGIETTADLKDYLDDNDKHYDLYKKVFKALGFRRNPGDEEMRRMNSWIDEWGFSTEKILEACAKSSGISNPNINYVDAVLKSWHEDSGKEKPAEDYFTEILAMYAKDREENTRKTAQIRQEIFSEIPRIRDIVDQQKDASYKISKNMFYGSAGKLEVERLRQKIKDLNEEKVKLLKENGYKEDAMNPIYTCNICKDTGELDDGTRCSCYNEKLRMLMN